MPEKWDGDLDELREPASAINPRRLIQGRIESRHAGPQQDGAESQQNPDSNETNRRKRPVKVPEPGAGNRAQTDRLEDLVNQAWKGQQPAPNDSRRNERDDLG